MFNVRKSFMVIAGLAAFINFIMMSICGWAIHTAIYFVMPMNIYTPEQFMQSSVLLSLGSMTLINGFLIKAGLYSTINKYLPEEWK